MNTNETSEIARLREALRIIRDYYSGCGYIGGLAKTALDPTQKSDMSAGVSEAEGIIAGILYEGSQFTIGMCLGKAVRILGAMRSVGWNYQPKSDE